MPGVSTRRVAGVSGPGVPVFERQAVVSLGHANAREGYELVYCIVPLSLKVIALLKYIIV